MADLGLDSEASIEVSLTEVEPRVITLVVKKPSGSRVYSGEAIRSGPQSTLATRLGGAEPQAKSPDKHQQ